MELKLVSETDNPLFGRKEVVYKAAGAPTPSRAKVTQAISDLRKCAKDAVVIDKIGQGFGQKTVTIEAMVYSTGEKAHQTERKYKFARLERSAGKKAEEKKA